MARYTPTTNSNPMFGQSGQTVRALQQRLNAQNAGLPGYTPLKVDGLYGPLTQAAARYKAPTSSSSSTSTTKKWSRLNAQEDPTKKGFLDAGKEPSYEDARNEASQGSQGLIDAIKASFNDKFRREREAGVGRAKRGQALNINAGLAGSTFASSNAGQIDEYNNEAIGAIEDEMNMKIADVLAGVASRASEIYEQRRSEYATKAEKSLEYRQQFAEQALNDISMLAQTGVSADNIKTESPDEWQQLLEETGKSDAELTAYFVANKPVASKLFEEKVGNMMVFGYKDPISGEITTEKVELPGNEWKFVANDGNPFFYDENTGQTKAIGGGFGGGGNSNGKKYTFTSAQQSKLIESGFNTGEIKAIETDLSAGNSIDDILAAQTDMTPLQKRRLRETLSGGEKTSASTGLSQDSVKTKFAAASIDEKLKAMGKEASDYKGFLRGGKKKEAMIAADFESYIDNTIWPIIQGMIDEGKTDEEIWAEFK